SSMPADRGNIIAVVPELRAAEYGSSPAGSQVHTQFPSILFQACTHPATPSLRIGFGATSGRLRRFQSILAGTAHSPIDTRLRPSAPTASQHPAWQQCPEHD